MGMCVFRKGGGVYLAQGVRLPSIMQMRRPNEFKDAKTDMSTTWFLGFELQHVGLTKIEYVSGIVFQRFDPELNGEISIAIRSAHPTS